MMSFTLFNKNITLSKYTIKLIIVFVCGTLIMTGHHLAVTTNQQGDGISVIRADGSDAQAAGDGGVSVDSANGEASVTEYTDLGSADGIPAHETGDSSGTENSVNGGAISAVAEEIGTGDSGDAYGSGNGVGSESMGDITDAANTASKDMIHVYVTGAVQSPGVYKLPRASMIVDAVGLAGGFSDKADTENVNLVFQIRSNAMIHIKRKSEQDTELSADTETGNTDSNNQSELYGSAVSIAFDDEGVLLTGDNADPKSDSESGSLEARRVNINQATQEELMTLPGIGKSTADKIIEYRKAQKFKRIEELMNINGIKQAKYDAIKDFISC